MAGRDGRSHLPGALDGATVDGLEAQGAAADYWYLSDFGIAGNGHMLMMEDNGDELAGLVVAWLEDRPPPHRSVPKT